MKPVFSLRSMSEIVYRKTQMIKVEVVCNYWSRMCRLFNMCKQSKTLKRIFHVKEVKCNTR